MPRVLLVSYPGYPSTPATLVANPWLANTAGALLAARHEVLALDYGTVAMMRRLYPEALTEQLRPLAARQAGGGEGDDESQFQMLRRISEALETHQAAVADQVAAEVAGQAAAWQPDLVALELADSDGYDASLGIARRLRGELPGVHLTVGGRKAGWFRELLLRVNPVLDSAVVGYPERVIPELADRRPVAGGSYDLPGLLRRGGAASADEGACDLDALPLPAYDPETYPAMAGDEKLKMPIITDSRGCANRCGFCVHPYEDGGRLIAASAAKIVDDLAALQQRHGFSVFRFGGASTPGRLVHEVAQEILRRGLRVNYSAFGHFRASDPDHFATLAQSGLQSIFFGLETGSQEILDQACHKGVKLAQVVASVRAAQAAGIFTAASMIVPLPFDTPETLAESLRFVTELRPDAVPLQFPGLFPGSRWIAHPERYNIEVEDVERLMLTGLSYRFKLLFPPQYWDPLPYRVNGLTFHEFTAVTMRFSADLEAAGILTNFSHTLAAVARAAEMPPRRLRDLARLWCVTGDAEAMGDMVRRANRNMLRPLQ